MNFGVGSEDWITVYPQLLPSAIGVVRDRILARGLQVPPAGPQLAHQEMNALMCKLLWGQLQSIGLFADAQPVKSLDELRSRTGMREMYGRWLEESAAELERQEYLLFDGKSYRAAERGPVDLTAAWQEWDACKADWFRDPGLKAQATLVEAALRVLPEILTGRILATDILFPDSSMALVEGIYKHNKVSDYYNEVLADTLVAYLEERLKGNPGARIRILEIGAGTGGTSATVFSRLQPYRDAVQEYCYTDISRAFLLHAEKEYGPQNPYLTYRIFNVEEPLAGQSVEAGAFDVVIATNVLHATKSIRNTLRNAKAAMQNNGLLLLNEMASNALFAHLTFGLLEGWWLYEDPALRMPGCPGVAPDTWKRVLETEGFRSVFLPLESHKQLGQQIIAAESDGRVRQQGRPAAPKTAPHPVQAATAAIAAPMAPDAQAGDLREKGIAYLQKLVGDTLRMPAHAIEPSAPLERYGIDSILVVQLTNALRKVMDNVSSTLFFEYQTIDSLIDHFLDTQKDALAALVGWQEAQASAPAAKPVATPAPAPVPSRRFLHARQPEPQPQPQHQPQHQPEAKPAGVGVQDVAIVGLSGRFPGAANVNEFWNRLREGANCITEIPQDRWDWQQYFDPEKGKWGTMYTKWGGFLDDIDKFDPLFFHISPAEAEQIDPQERLFLQAAYSSIEDAGYTPASLSATRKVGVFVGVMNGHYATGARYWSIANRLSYLMNFQGPSLSVDTACSSSLTAIHLALESLYTGTSDIAIAGGVNLIVDPVHYVQLSAMSVLSTGDECRSFGDGADGFVDGEGVGAVVLKTLEKALADGDHIYGVIKGSMLNAGGKTNGYTVPNPVAQGDVIQGALERAGIDARAVSYLEAHGTGTALGDPIEIAGLTRAFGKHTADKQYCAIGSVKSNIGHCESAAGIAGIAKILLQMKHRQLAPSLHADVINPEIDFSRTPFALQRELTEWQRPVIGGREQPRIAGISSFGAGGANVHVLIQEFEPQESLALPLAEPAVFVLSAKNRERLQELAGLWVTALANGDYADEHLASIAYTLQAGREPMEERLALKAVSIADLQEKLQGFLDGRAEASGVHVGRVKRGQKVESHELLESWVNGANVDWAQLYGPQKPRRISLPTYPFAKESYWVQRHAASVKTDSMLHPLLHRNTSNLLEMRYSSSFTGQEFFFADHAVQGRKLLPGAAHLEMARAAVELAAEPDASSIIRLKHVAFSRPLTAGDVHLSLNPEDNGTLAFEIYGEADDVYSQGTAVLVPAVQAPVLDIASIQAQCDRRTLHADDLYESFKKMGVLYGPAHQGVETIYSGEGQVLARLSLPETGEYVMHPGLLDSALQASVGLMLGDRKPLLPFAVEELDVFSSLASSMWAVLRKQSGDDRVQKLDIDLCDDQGRVCVRIKGYSARVLDTASDVLLLQPQWREAAIDGQAIEASRHVVMMIEPADLAPALEGAEVAILSSGEPEDIAQQFQSCAAQAFEILQKILREKPTGRVLVQMAVPHQLSGLAGLLKTAALENPQLTVQLIELEPGETAESIAAKLQENRLSPADSQIRYQAGARLVASWEEVPSADLQAPIPWKKDGVYLITGGAGGLGRIFAREIVSHVPGATVIVAGRSPLPASLELDAIYRQVDVTDAQAVSNLIADIRREYGGLNGILHSAGVIRDNYIIKKTREELLEVLAPKVAGLVNLDAATQNDALDFFVLFSSGTGATGNPGQADYAAANAFMDAYASERNASRGRTLSLNWPLWAEGGMQLDAQTAEMIRESLGMTAMQTADGIRAFYQALASGRDRVMVLSGNASRLRSAFLKQPKQAQPGKRAAAPAPERIREKAVHYFKRLLSSVIKLPAHRIEGDAPLENYGIDSLLVMKMTAQLEETFGALPKTLFFEYQTIEELAGYFLETYRDQLTDLMGVATARTVEEPVEPIAVTGKRKRSRFLNQSGTRPAKASQPQHQDIAIIGVSGRYPQARNLAEYWRNLRDGKDCVTEIPSERWDHSLYFDEDKNKPGTTYSKWGGFLDGVDRFDPLFFNISPREAEVMDPQERLFLECVYAALEDAGYTREDLAARSSVGVFVGAMYEEYQLYGAQETLQGRPMALSGSLSSIANRVSYFCNFHGPSLAIDTMCSSSLTAIHLAVQSLQRGECATAIAGGVNVSVHPNKYLMLAQGKFASTKGRCETFGADGDGYVPGEGVGAVLLKPLAQAIADGDHIYGVIKGTAINHGGKTNGYSVPNPHAQAAVITRALQEAGVDPRTVSYLEAHGTGTALGDPIEIAGLSKAFGEFTQDRQFCAIGSAKSNIGHCESAAGIAGLTKVLLQMKHGQLAPSLHSQTLNPHIDFASTPFIVQQELAEWERPLIDGKEHPRIAGISAFGAGGSNAHVVIEEYIPEAAQPMRVNTALVVLSAKSEDRLQAQAQQLLAAVREGELSLTDLAFTLQVGREAMEERLALTAASLDELAAKLQAYLEGDENIDDLYRGQVKPNREALAVFSADEDMESILDIWIAKGKYGKLLDLWVKGLAVDWSKLYGEQQPRRISLPTYPFAGERYWVPQIGTKQAATLHPLLHENTSDFSEQRYSTTFTGQETFLRDHVVNGQRVLPGVAALEMARAAVLRATGAESGVKLHNVVWVRPLAVTAGSVQAHIGLRPEANGEIAFQIYDTPDNAFSQGKITLTSSAEAPILDLAAIRAQCNGTKLSADACYEAFRNMGLSYGPSYQGIETLYIGQGQVLAKLSLPSDSRFYLQPGLLDAALQASIGLRMGMGAIRPALPFALEEAEILGASSSDMWALIRYSAGSQPGDAVEKLDIDLCDENGQVRVRLKGFSSRVMDGVARPPVGTFLLRPVWDGVQTGASAQFPQAADRVVLIGGTEQSRSILRKLYPAASDLALLPNDSIDSIADKLTELGTIDHLVWMPQLASASDEESWIGEQNNGVLQVFRLTKALIRTGYAAKNLGWTVITLQTQRVRTTDCVDPTHASVHGLIGSMAKEHPTWNVRLADLDAVEENALRDLFTLPADPQGNAWARRSSQWYRQRLIPFQGPPTGPTRYRQGGVYVVIGGAGGIGEVWSEYMIRTYAAQIVWIGRRPQDEAIQAQVSRLAAFGPAPLYVQADASDRSDLERAYAEIKHRCGSIHGVVHSAIVLLDQSLAQMEEERFRSSLTAKVDVSVRMAQVFDREPLDFALFFSSMNAFTKSAGQSNYAAGCTFKDAFAAQLAAEWTCPVKVMNWGYWGSVGIVASQAYRDRMVEIGLGSIEAPEAMDALEALLSGPADQVALMKTTKPLLLGEMNAEEVMTAYPAELPSRIGSLRERMRKGKGGKLLEKLRRSASAILQVSVDDIDADADLGEYGFDPHHLSEFAAKLDLPTAVLVEHGTLRSLAVYLEKASDRTLQLTTSERGAL